MTVDVAPVGPVGEIELTSIVDAVWTCALGTDDAPVPGPSVAAHGPWLRAGVGIAGGWDGAVTVECTRSAAVSAASSMFGLSPELVEESDARDALGELANVVGGGVKGLLPERNQLTLPVVEALLAGVGPDEPLGEVACRLELTWRGEPLVVTVVRTSTGEARP